MPIGKPPHLSSQKESAMGRLLMFSIAIGCLGAGNSIPFNDCDGTVWKAMHDCPLFLVTNDHSVVEIQLNLLIESHGGSVQHIDFQSINLNPDLIELIGKVIRFGIVRHMKLVSCNLTDEGISMIEESIRAPSSRLTSLDLSHNDICYDECRILRTLSEKLNYVVLSGNSFGTDVAKLLACAHDRVQTNVTFECFPAAKILKNVSYSHDKKFSI